MTVLFRLSMVPCQSLLETFEGVKASQFKLVTERDVAHFNLEVSCAPVVVLSLLLPPLTAAEHLIAFSLFLH